jgi:serine/threonine protein kinase
MTDHVGRRFGDYHLIRSLGKGSFAKVYLGTHTTLGKQVAVKVLHACLANEEVESFRDEARAIASLKHPNIVRVLDFGIEDTAPYIVMEYFPNGSLSQRLPSGTAMPLATVVSYVQQIAAALQFAHDRKLVHCDLKPENILVESDSNLLLSDFGIAVITQSRGRTGNSQLDEVGTPSYMAPEQFQGNPCYASDQYSLALITYEWLCGTPLVRESHRAMSAQDLPAYSFSLNKGDHTIAPVLEEVVRKGLARDPQQRFPSISAFAQALERAAQIIDRTETCTKESDFPSNSLEDEQLFEDLVTASRQLKEEEILEEALTELSWLERTCLLLRVDAGFNITEIAEIVGASER